MVEDKTSVPIVMNNRTSLFERKLNDYNHVQYVLDQYIMHIDITRFKFGLVFQLIYQLCMVSGE